MLSQLGRAPLGRRLSGPEVRRALPDPRIAPGTRRWQMDWKWTLLTIVATAVGFLVCRLSMTAVDEARCPYKVGTDLTDCNGSPCERRPPCLYA